MDERTLVLNQLAQGHRPFPEGMAWFEGQTEEEQARTLRALGLFCRQAHATREEAAEAIRLSGLRPTCTPCVLLARGDVDRQVSTIGGLRPRHERLRAFRLLVHLLAVADARRRERHCADGCGHEWHHLPPRPDAAPQEAR
ncbi:DUF5958 family protein [Streptomyces sp. NPDC005012]|uniref:DUF5958 family protein n=1 Tax=unclassified Streptomyces TaxID=2593676 RepID=UPI0033A3D2D6